MNPQPDKSQELGNESIRKLLFKYSSPAIVGMVFNSLYNLVDTIFVGQGGGTLAIAGLAIALPIQMFLMAIAQTVGIGSSSIISRSLGAGNQRKAELAAGNSFTIVAILSILFTVIGLTFLDPLLLLYGATDTILPYSREYMSVILMGSFFFTSAMSTMNIVRSEGFAKTAMVSMILGTVTNMILDPIFIFTFDMGIRGAALATIIAQAGSFTYLLSFYLRRKSSLHIRRSDLNIDWTLVPEVFVIGASSFVRTVAQSLLSITVNRSLAHYGTDIHIAVLGVANRLIMFTMMPVMGILQGLQPIIGFNYGARQIKRVKESLKLGILVSSSMAAVGFTVLMLATKPLVQVFNNDPVLIREAVPLIRVMVACIPLIGWQMVGASFFQAIGRAVPALFLSMSRQVLFLIPIALILPMFLGIVGIFLAFPLADLLSTLVTAIWLKREERIMNKKFAPLSAKQAVNY